jgi:3-keto-5-aminohexanoate cleavage enzyme
MRTVPDVEPLIINLALTGMVPTKEMTPHVPISAEEILDDVAHCAQLGVSIVHVHARDENGLATHRSESFAPLIEGVRSIDRELVVCATCSGRFTHGLEQRAEVLDLTGDAKPDMGSLTLGSNNFRNDASVNPPDVIEGLARRMQDREIKPELEVFEPGMLEFGKYLARKGLIQDPGYVNILLGNLATSPLSPGSLSAFVSLMPTGWTWAVAGIGRAQLDANMLAIAAGGHVRVGLEDNIWWDRGRSRLATNSMLVERICRLAEHAERPIASPAIVRKKLRLSRPASVRSAQPTPP